MIYQNSPLSDSIVEALGEIRDIYSNFFDQSWFTSFLVDFPMESGQFHDIRYSLTIISPTKSDIPILHLGIRALENFTKLLTENVLPKISDLLIDKHIDQMAEGMTKEMKLYRKIVAYSLPMNIEKLESLTKKVKDLLPSMPNK